MTRIVYITNISKQIQYIRSLQEETTLETMGLHVELWNMKQKSTWGEDIQRLMKAADAVIMTHMGSGLDTPFLEKLGHWLYEHHPCYALFVHEPERPDLMHRHITAEQMKEIERYRYSSGRDNYLNLFAYVASLTGAEVNVAPPAPPLWQGIVGLSGETYATYDDYIQGESLRDVPRIGVFFYREEWIANELYYPLALGKAIQENGYEPILFFGQYSGKADLGIPSLKQSMKTLFGDTLPMDVLINTGKFSLLGLQAATLEDLVHRDIPILQGYTIYMEEGPWRDSVQGLGPLDVNLSVSLPEMDGAIQGGVVACQTKQPDGSFVYIPVEERIQSIVKRAGKYVTLRHKPVKDQKIAIILHNYPPKNSNIGSAAGLDTPESVQGLLKAMKEAGYTLADVPADGAALMDRVLSHTTNDLSMMDDERIAGAEGKLSREAYQQFFATVPDQTAQHMEDGWGPAPGEFFRFGDELLIPGFQNGNLWITVQPPRGLLENPEALYHDPFIAPTHHYQGFYYWLRHVFQADAVVHVGTHGSLEWLPGKGTGLSLGCYPELGIQELPNVYPYWTTIVGEGIQAKRRSSACLIGHLTPPLSSADLYDEYEELDVMLDEYDHFRRESPEQGVPLMEQIRHHAVEHHMIEADQEAQLSDEDLFNTLHTLLNDMKYMQIRTGLHILGKAPEGEEKRELLWALTRFQNGDVPSLPEALAEAMGQVWTDLEGHPEEFVGIYRKSHVVDAIWEAVRHILAWLDERHYAAPTLDELKEQVRDLAFLGPLEASGMEKACQVAKAICETYSPHIDRTTDEITNTLRALQGRYVEPGPGGAPTTGRADILPTGRNFYGMDERTLPTKFAYELGCQLGDQVIESYIREEGKYPESIGMVLWAGSNTRSHGQCLGEFLYLLGVRPKWQGAGGRVTGLEVIPLEELQRPRIDVMGRISGLIRDMMPNAIQWLHKAVCLVADLDESEEDNYVKKHIHDDVTWLVSEGDEEAQAFEKARLRIFGDPPGTYGAGVGKVIESKNWSTIEDLGNVYVKWSGYHYGGKKGLPQDERLFRRRLATMEVTIKNEDNHETHMLSSDDYNAYHGGLIAAVRAVSGQVPKSYVGDSTNRQRAAVRTLAEETRRVVRGETLNPKFIEGMKQHGYKGASDLANVVAHSFAWDATSGVMEDWMYEGYAHKYALDEDMQAWMREVNPWALSRMAETLLEAIQRGMWQAPKELEEELKELYLTMEGDMEDW